MVNKYLINNALYALSPTLYTKRIRKQGEPTCVDGIFCCWCWCCSLSPSLFPRFTERLEAGDDHNRIPFEAVRSKHRLRLEPVNGVRGVACILEQSAIRDNCSIVNYDDRLIPSDVCFAGFYIGAYCKRGLSPTSRAERTLRPTT